MAEHIEVARAFVTIVPSMEGSQATITKELTGVTNEASEKAGEEGGSKFGEKFAGAIKGATAAIGAAMAAATGAAIATGKAFIDTANDVSAAGDAIGDNAAKMGISTQAYQEWDFVLQRAGTSIDSMKTAMKTLANAAVEGNDAFEALGISQEQLATMSQEEIFGATITALQNVEDSTTRTALASKLLGKGAIELGAVFEMTAEETEAAKQKMYELGAYMDEDAIAASDNYQDTMIDLQDSIGGLKKRVVGDFLPGITSVMTGLSKVFSGNGGAEEIQSGLESIIGNITALAPQFFSLAETLIMSLISGFGPMLPQLASSIFSVIVQAIVTVTSMIPQMMPSIIAGIQGILTALFQALPLIIDGIFTLVMSLLEWLTADDNITNFINSIIQLTVDIVNRFSEILPILLPAIVQIITEVCLALTSPENIKALVGAVLNLAGAIFVALVNCVPVLIDFVIGLFDQMGGLVAEGLAFIIPKITEWAVNVYNKFKSWGDSIKNFITNLVNSVKNTFTNWINNLKNSFTNGFNNIKQNISNIVEKIKSFITNVINMFKQLPNNLQTIGHNMIVGLWNGISNVVEWIMDKVSGFGNTLINKVKDIFGIHSPSKVFAGIGENLAAGLGVGFSDEIGAVEDDIENSLTGMTASMTADVTAYASQGAMLGGSGSTYNGGAVTINVYGAEGQNVDDLAQAVAYKLEDMTRRREAVFNG